MITIRRSQDRGHFNHGWLDTYHTFSFGRYQDAAHMGFRSLRVINDDRVAPGAGFGMHPHRDMEIITLVLEGVLEHRDSLGNGEVIEPGEVQCMTAGTGITHSEHNPSRENPVHLLQIWILPEKPGLKPSYAQKSFPDEEREGKLRLVVSRGGIDGSLTIHQDANIYHGRLAQGMAVRRPLTSGRHAWIQVARGSLQVNGEALAEGDGAAISDEPSLQLLAAEDAELLFFDLA